MERIVLFILVALLSSCSAKYHLQKSKKHELLAIAKGAKIKHPDTVYKEVEVKVFVRGSEFDDTFAPVIDTAGFHNTIKRNDSLVLVIDKLAGELERGESLNKEKTMSALKAANGEIRALRDRLSKGFMKDSVYVVAPDSLTTLKIEIKDGLLKSIGYSRKDAVVSGKQNVPIEINRILEYGYTYWQVLASGLGVLLIGLIVGYIIGILRKKRE